MSLTQTPPITNTHAEEIQRGERFAFGANWLSFLSVLNDTRIREAEKSLQSMLEVHDLRGKSFLDLGSGSGLFSLAAKRLGARVVSLDYDPQAVACTQELKRRYFDQDHTWTITEGSVLDPESLKRLGKFDVVYSWGVLHHTGAMWQALANVAGNVAQNGKLFLSLYNDQGVSSKRWRTIKRLYVRSPRLIQWLIVLLLGIYLGVRKTMRRLIRGKVPLLLKEMKRYQEKRGMSYFHDVVDWAGGYPFEVSKPEEVFDFYRSRGYTLIKLKTCGGGHGCNEYVFQFQPEKQAPLNIGRSEAEPGARA